MSAPAGAAESGDALAVLMAVRVKGRAAIAAVADASGVAAAGVRAVLTAACARGVARALDGDRYALTADGKAEVAVLAARAAVDRARLAVCYDEFLAHDGVLKQAITAWQEERSTARFAAVRATATSAMLAVERLAMVAARYAAYGRRLGRVRDRLAAGDDSAVAHPGGDSLHQVWFELHEDVLVMLGRTRTA